MDFFPDISAGSQDFEGEEEAVELSFAKNGEALGAAFRVAKAALAGRALLPHVLCKGCVVELNFGQRAPPFFPTPATFIFIRAVPVEDRVRTPLPPKTTEECEVSAADPWPPSPVPLGGCGCPAPRRPSPARCC